MMRERGMVLLPVTLALAIVGTLAYAMTRDGVMNVSAVDAQFDVDNARYLAEGGINLLKWRNDRAACGTVLGFNGAITALDGGTLAATNVVLKGKNKLTATMTATTARGTVNQIVLDDPHALPVYDLTRKTEITIASQNSTDTFIRDGGMVSSGLPYLEVTEGSAHGLIAFGLASVPPDSKIVEATLRLFLGSNQSTQAGSLGIHRMVRAWPFLGMSWSVGWTNKGGDFAPQPSATIANVLPLTWYTARIDGLVANWVSQPPTNLGLLLKPTGLLTARFNSFEAGSNPPQIFLRYYPLCK